MQSITLPEGKNIYFASDFHLGLPNYKESIVREKMICQWLESIASTAYKIYLVGDLFDVWFEYKKVVPKGYTRFLGTLARLSDAGVQIEIFTGNHDLWMKDYFMTEMNIPVHYNPIQISINNTKFFIGHGDGLGPGDKGYKLLKSIMSNKVSQWIYRLLHPNIGIGIADYFSKKGEKHYDTSNQFLGPDQEWLVQFCNEELKSTHYDYFIFGHRHLAITYPLSSSSSYINLGDWLHFNTYAVFDGSKTVLIQYQ